jgi:hypothetical protein
VLCGSVVFVVHLFVSRIVGPNGWDDGAITLSFARTFAESGRIALTPLSEQVEGFSSVGWFLAMSILARAGWSNFSEIIAAAQFLSAACTASAASLWVVASRTFMRPWAGAAISACLFVASPFLNETMNGMEMSLLALLVLAQATLLTVTYRYHLLSLALLAALSVTVRFEAVLYIVGACALAWFVSSRRREFAALAAGGMAAFAALEAVRYAVFRTWLPNTLTAKQWPPYSQPGVIPFLVSRTRVAAEPFLPFAAALLMLLMITILMRHRTVRRFWQRSDLAVVFGLCYFVAVWAFNVAIGRNWGYTGRMQLSALPVMTLAIVAMLVAAGIHLKRAPAAATLAVMVIGTSPFIQAANLRAAVSSSLPVAAGVRISPQEYRRTGEDVDAIRRKLDMNRLNFMTPDVGGSSLCCTRLRIIDIGLLTNTALARGGFAQFDAFLTREAPDVIEVHGVWSEASKIYESPFFRENYLPVVLDHTWLWVRADHASRLPEATHRVLDESTLRNRGAAIDEEFAHSLRERRRYLDFG